MKRSLSLKVGVLAAGGRGVCRERRGARSHGRVVGRRVPGRAARSLFQAVHGDRRQDGRGELGRRRGHAAHEDQGRQQQLGRRAGGVRRAAHRLRGRPLREARLGEARRQGQVPAGCGATTAASAPSSTASCSPTTATRSRATRRRTGRTSSTCRSGRASARCARARRRRWRSRCWPTASPRRTSTRRSRTDAGVERAFKKLDQIKGSMVWWEKRRPAAADSSPRVKW